MKFFADTAEIDEIRELAATGLLDGVTTNPSLIAKTGRNFIETVRRDLRSRRRSGQRRGGRDGCGDHARRGPQARRNRR